MVLELVLDRTLLARSKRSGAQSGLLYIVDKWLKDLSVPLTVLYYQTEKCLLYYITREEEGDSLTKLIN